MKVVFSSTGTYAYYENEGSADEPAWTEMDNGNYSWNSSSPPKNVFFAPTKARMGDVLYDKAGWKVAYRNAAPEGITDADIPGITDGQYTTVTAFINAAADKTFGIQAYTYTMDGEAIATLSSVVWSW
jgi:hypothetical protein